jgi:glycosyltransferase involved in cell wall biosynthesis
MRIGFDVSQTAESMAGCGIFASELFKALVEVAPDHTFLPYPVFCGYRSATYREAVRPLAGNVLALHHDLDWIALNEGWDRSDNQAEFLGHPDVVHSNSFGCPHGLGVPVVYTIHDLSVIDRPEFHTEENRLICFNGLFEASILADRFIAVSRFSRDRFLHWFPHVEPDRVTVVHEAARFGQATGGANDAETLSRLGLTSDNFFLAVGTIEPRKNYTTLIEAYAKLVAAVPDAPRLCVVGKPGWKEAPIGERAERLGLGDRLVATGFLADEDLAVLYRHTRGFVFPSHYEGFGLPVIEALASGAPVIASHTSSLPEVVGSAGLLVAPDDVEGLTAAMRRLIDEPALVEQLKKAAVVQAARFSWREAARLTMEVYEKTTSGVVLRKP